MEKLHPADPIDLAASAIASRVTVILAAEIAATLRRLEFNPALLLSRTAPRDATAAERQRRFRARRRASATLSQGS
ncbi:MAG: hypothetical protein HXY30_16025 [Pseudorhodoplanes sp.]|nr:hypothetical protein [Pseudorhodoplanes sp.]